MPKIIPNMQKLRPDLIQEMRKTMTMRQIAELYEVNLATLYGYCRRNKVITYRFIEEDLDEETEEMNAKEIALKFNVSLSTVYQRTLRQRLQKKLSQKMTIKEIGDIKCQH